VRSKESRIEMARTLRRVHSRFWPSWVSSNEERALLVRKLLDYEDHTRAAVEERKLKSGIEDIALEDEVRFAQESKAEALRLEDFLSAHMWKQREEELTKQLEDLEGTRQAQELLEELQILAQQRYPPEAAESEDGDADVSAEIDLDMEEAPPAAVSEAEWHELETFTIKTLIKRLDVLQDVGDCRALVPYTECLALAPYTGLESSEDSEQQGREQHVVEHSIDEDVEVSFSKDSLTDSEQLSVIHRDAEVSFSKDSLTDSEQLPEEQQADGQNVDEEQLGELKEDEGQLDQLQALERSQGWPWNDEEIADESPASEPEPQWDPNVMCGWYPASGRAEWLMSRDGLTEQEAQADVMSEFDVEFGRPTPGWNKNIMCGSFTAERREMWLVREFNYSKRKARRRVMSEFVAEFGAPTPGWYDGVLCGSFTAGDRAAFLTLEQDWPLLAAREQVMKEFSREFASTRIRREGVRAIQDGGAGDRGLSCGSDQSDKKAVNNHSEGMEQGSARLKAFLSRPYYPAVMLTPQKDFCKFKF